MFKIVWMSHGCLVVLHKEAMQSPVGMQESLACSWMHSGHICAVFLGIFDQIRCPDHLVMRHGRQLVAIPVIKGQLWTAAAVSLIVHVDCQSQAQAGTVLLVLRPPEVEVPMLTMQQPDPECSPPDAGKMQGLWVVSHPCVYVKGCLLYWAYAGMSV